MYLQTADVNDLICLIFNQLDTLIESENYGIECDADETLTEIKKLYSYVLFKCYTADYVRNYVIDNEAGLPEYCDRFETESGVPR